MKESVFVFEMGEELGSQGYGSGCDVPLTLIGALPLEFPQDGGLDGAIVTEDVEVIVRNPKAQDIRIWCAECERTHTMSYLPPEDSLRWYLDHMRDEHKIDLRKKLKR